MTYAEDSLERACESLDIAEKLIDVDAAASANRIYNAGENIAIAIILLTSGRVPKSHGKMWNAINSLFRKGTLSLDYKPVLETSYRLRIKGDYGRDLEGKAITMDRDALRNQIIALRSFFSEVSDIVNSQEN